MDETLEHFLESLSDLEREELATMRQHAYSMYTLDGQHWARQYENENLLNVLLHMERYVVDTNSNWKMEAAKPENRDKAFIIGRTLSDEESNLKGIFFGPKVDTRNNNIFCLGVEQTDAGPVVQIERLDSCYRSTFDETSLLVESQPREKRSDLKFLEWTRTRAANVQHEKECVLLILGIKDIADLRFARDLVGKRAQFERFIRRQAPRCLGKWKYTVGVARHCYALLLIEDRQVRTEFSRHDYDNVFGDVLLVHNALFLQARILSNDKHLKRMASYAGIPWQSRIS